MAEENAGTIYAEIRLDLDELKKGVVQAVNYVKNLQVQIKKSAAETSKEGANAGTGFFSGLKKGFDRSGEEAAKLGTRIAKILTPAIIGLAAGIKTIQAIGGAIKDAFLSNEKFREGIENLKSALGESFSASVRPVSNFFAGLIENAAKGIRQANDLRAALKRLREEVPDYGDTLDEELDNARKDFDALDAEVNKLREDMANPLMADIMGPLDDRLKRILPELDEARKELEKIQSVTGNANPDSLKKFADIEKELAVAEKQIKLLYDENSEEYNNARLSALNNYTNAVSKLVAENNIANANINQGLEDQIAEYNKLKEKIEAQKQSANLLTQAKEAYGKTLAQIKNQEDAYFIGAEEAMEKRLQAEKQYVQALSGLRTEYRQLEGAEDGQEAHIAALEAASIANTKALETTIARQKEYDAETGRLRAEYEKISAEMGNETTFAEIMAGEAERRAAQLERQRDAELAALETRYAAIAAEHESGELTEEETARREMLTEAINKNYGALEKLAKSQAVSAAQRDIAGYTGSIEEEWRGILHDMAEQNIMQDAFLTEKEKELALNELSRAEALEELRAEFDRLEAQREGAGLTEEEIALREDLTYQINRNYDAIAGGIEEAEKEKINFKEITVQIAQASASALTSITSAAAEIARMRAEEAIAEIDRELAEANERIEEQRRAALEAEGFMEAERAEDMRAHIDAARDANDQVLQYQLERRQREAAINEEWDARAKAEEEKAAREKAELEYGAAKAKYASDITSAIVAGAMAVTQAANNMWPVPAIPMMAAAGTAASAEMAVILANPPKMPKFADGGIVPGAARARADTVAAMLTPGEVILNRAQQESLAPQLGGDLTVQINLDGRRIGETVIGDYVNKGIILIEASRGIR